jgi:hypothetical protein
MKLLFTLLITLLLAENTTAQSVMIPYRKDSLWGYANEAGKIVVEPKYSNTRFFYKSKYAYPEKKIEADKILYGIVDGNGKIISEPKYRNVSLIRDIDFSYKAKNNVDGYYLENNRIKFAEKYGEYYFVVSTNDLIQTVQMIDSTSKIIIDNLQSIAIVKTFKDGEANLMVSKNNKYGLININGKTIIPIVYDWIDYYASEDDKDVMIIRKEKAYALIDGNGKVLIPSKSRVIKKYRNYENVQGLFQVFENEKSAIFYADGKMLTPFSNKKVYVKSKSKAGKEVLSFIYENEIGDEIAQAVYERTYVQAANMAMEKPPADYISKDNTSDPQTEWQNYINTRVIDGFSIIIKKTGDKYGVKRIADSSIIIDAIYDTLYWAFPRGDNRIYLIASKKNKFGLIQSDNEISIPFLYKKLQPIEFVSLKESHKGNFIATNKKNIIGLLDEENNIIIPFNYESLEYFPSGKYSDTSCEFIAKNKKSLFGLINNHGEILIPETYKKLYGVESNYYNKTNKYFYVLNEQNKYGIISQNNSVFLPLIYDSILAFYNLFDRYNTNSFTNSAYSVRVNGKFGIANKSCYLFEPIANEPMLLLNNNLSDSTFYAVSNVTNSKDQNLFCSKNGLLVNAEKKYNFVLGENYINDFKNGVIKFTDNKTGLFGIIINNKKLEIVPAKYNAIGVYDFYANDYAPKNKTVKYYALNNYPYSTTADIITNTGIKFFEDTVTK